MARRSALQKQAHLKQPTPTLSPARQPFARSSIAVALLVLAAAAWGVVFLWQSRASPAERHVEAGIEYANSGQNERAVREWRAAIALDPDNADAWELLAGHYYALAAWRDAADSYRQLLRLHRTSAEVYSRLAECNMRLGDVESAGQYAQEALKRNPNDTESLRICAIVFRSTLQPEQSRQYLRRLAALKPNDPETLTRLAADLALGNAPAYEEARDMVERILQLDPNHAQAYALRGVIRLTTDLSPQGLAQAEADLRRSLQLAPSAPFPRFYLGRVYRRKGEPEKAIAELEQAASAMPDKKEIFFELAAVYKQINHTKKAEEARKKFAALQKQSEWETTLLQRVANDPNSFEDNYQLGLLFLKKGQHNRARHYLEKARSLRPDDRKVKAALEQPILSEDKPQGWPD